MSFMNTNLKLALVLALSLLGLAACNSKKAEQVEEEDAATETQSDAAPTRDNRNTQSGDAAFIKIFPDGEVAPSKGASETVPVAQNQAASTSSDGASAPAESPTPAMETETTATPAPADGSSGSPANAGSGSGEQLPAASPAQETQTPAAGDNQDTTGSGNEQPAPVAEPVVVQEPLPTPAVEPMPEPIVINDPVLESSPTPITEAGAWNNLIEDYSRPVLAVNESTTAQIIAVMPKANLSIVSIGKHKDFVPGPYAILGKWTSDSSKVKIKIKSNGSKEKDCGVDETPIEGDWKVMGVFYLTKNAKVMITNTSFSAHTIKNELLLKPVLAEKLTKPSIFHCLGGQILGHGLTGRP